MTTDSSCNSSFGKREDLRYDDLSEVCKEFTDLCEELSASEQLTCQMPNHVQLNVLQLQDATGDAEDSQSSQESLVPPADGCNDDVFLDGLKERSGSCLEQMIEDIIAGSAGFIPIPRTCVQHNQVQEYFCNDCGVVACTECLNEAHATHDSVELSVALGDMSSQLKKSLQPARQCMSITNASLQRLEQDKEAIESNQIFCSETIKNLFYKVRAAVDEKERHLLKALDRYIDGKLTQVRQKTSAFNEIKSQLSDSIEEVHGMLKGTSKEISVIVDKNEFVEEIELLAERVGDIETNLNKSNLSSTYAGFHDYSNTFQEKIDEIVSMCEYYPDEESGYYTSRVISLESDEEDEEETENQDFLGPPCFSYDNGSPHSLVETAFISSANSPSQSSILQRSYSTPTGMTRPPRLRSKRGSDVSEVSLKGPLIPIRYQSLRVATAVKTPLRIFDKLSSSKMEVVNPCGICSWENNSFIITDVRNHCLRIISSSGKCVGDIGKEGKSFGQFEDPAALIVCDKKYLLVCQRENSRVQKLSSAGKFVKKFGQKSIRGTSLGEPWDLVAAPNGKIYVTDWDKSCIHVFNKNGDHIGVLGGDNSLLGESLRFPAGIAMNAEGELVVVDRGNHCLWLLRADGHILRRISSKGHSSGELYFPFGVAVHHNGLIVVSDSGNNRISVFSSSGKFLNCFGERGSEPGMFLFPRHICITSSGQLAVADELNHRLQLFDL